MPVTVIYYKKKLWNEKLLSQDVYVYIYITENSYAI